MSFKVPKFHKDRYKDWLNIEPNKYPEYLLTTEGVYVKPKEPEAPISILGHLEWIRIQYDTYLDIIRKKDIVRFICGDDFIKLYIRDSDDIYISLKKVEKPKKIIEEIKHALNARTKEECSK